VCVCVSIICDLEISAMTSSWSDLGCCTTMERGIWQNI